MNICENLSSLTTNKKILETSLEEITVKNGFEIKLGEELEGYVKHNWSLHFFMNLDEQNLYLSKNSEHVNILTNELKNKFYSFPILVGKKIYVSTEQTTLQTLLLLRYLKDFIAN